MKFHLRLRFLVSLPFLAPLNLEAVTQLRKTTVSKLQPTPLPYNVGFEPAISVSSDHSTSQMPAQEKKGSELIRPEIRGHQPPHGVLSV
ncbi:hypothetical protein F5Y03DRAFT_137691 [Xylaria venustula]|nr:hypothetical protein F5Y03DRAFT_137691 [Xylaria venustula]